MSKSRQGMVRPDAIRRWIIIRTAKIEERTAESVQNVPNDELISKKAAMEPI